MQFRNRWEYTQSIVKNKTPLIVVGVIALVAVGAFLFMRQNGSLPASLTGSPTDMFSNALTGSGSVTCEYTDESGQKVMAYVKGGKIRSDITGGEQGSMSFIMKDKTMYSWNTDTKQGFIYKIPDVTGSQTQDEAQTPDQGNVEDVKADLEQYKESCKGGNISDSMFDIPSDVTLQDYSQMMQDSLQQVPDEYKQYMPQQ